MLSVWEKKIHKQTLEIGFIYLTYYKEQKVGCSQC